MASHPIRFYRATDAYGCFSNFSKHEVVLGGYKWKTSEHYFQAMKFEGTPHFHEVRNAPTPGDSAKMGRSRARPLRADWEQIKDQVMYDVVLAKVQQHQEMRDLLMGSGDALIVEHTHNDSYWGDGGDGTGRNQLGITLMNVRTFLRQQQK